MICWPETRAYSFSESESGCAGRSKEYFCDGGWANAPPLHSATHRPPTDTVRSSQHRLTPLRMHSLLIIRTRLLFLFLEAARSCYGDEGRIHRQPRVFVTSLRLFLPGFPGRLYEGLPLPPALAGNGSQFPQSPEHRRR